jgi:ribosomal protein S18 acetylase RimI-like enzyme
MDAASGEAAEAGAPCRLLDWDSEHFGFPIARVAGATLTARGAEAVDRWCLERGIRCLYFLADAADADSARVAAARNYRALDARITIRHSLERVEELPSFGPEGITVREASEADLGFARLLAARSHHGSRFYFDGGFPADRCDALYEAWVERGFRDPARTVRVPEVDGEPVGYHVTGPLGPEREGRGELLAIEERWRRHGVAMALTVAGLRSLAERGATTYSATLSGRNVRAIRKYERLGSLTERVELWHHKWFEPGDGG